MTLLIALDLETAPTVPTTDPYALEPYRVLDDESKITSCALHDTEGNSNQLILNEDNPQKIVEIVERLAGHVVYCHNAIFDTGFLYAHMCTMMSAGRASKIMGSVRWRDTAILYKYLVNGQVASAKNTSYSLAECVRRALKTHPKYEEFLDVKSGWHVPGEDDEYWEHRGRLDAEMTVALAEYLESKLTDDMKPGYLASCSAIWPLAEGWVTGIPLDMDRVLTYEQEALKKQKQLVKEIGLPATTFSSPKQLGHYLFHTLGLEPVMRTPKGAPSTNAESMLRLHQQNPDNDALGKIMEYRKINTMLSKYIGGFKNTAAYMGKPIMHASPRILATITGRMTYSSKIFKKFPISIAQHQIPRKDKAIKKCMVAPPGYKVMYMDVSAQEGRFMAIMGPEPNMIRSYNEGLDLHSDLTEEIFGTPYEVVYEANQNDEPKEIVEQRQAGKLTGLSSFYRIGAKALAGKFFTTYEYDISIQTAQSYLTSFKRKYPGVPEYWRRAIGMARRVGYAEAIGGWRYRIKSFDWKGESSAINHPIQGSGAIQTYTTIGVIKNKWPRCILVAQVHDSLSYFVPEDEIVETARDIKSTMDNFNYGALLNFTQSVPIVLDVAIGDNLSDLTNITSIKD